MFIHTDVKIAHVEDNSFVVQLQWNHEDGTSSTKEFALEDFPGVVLKLGEFFGQWEQEMELVDVTEGGFAVVPVDIMEEIKEINTNAAFD